MFDCDKQGNSKLLNLSSNDPRIAFGKMRSPSSGRPIPSPMSTGDKRARQTKDC